MPLTDDIIALGRNGDTVEQGTFEELNQSDNYVRSLAVQETETDPHDAEPAGKLILGPISPSLLVDAMDDKKRQLGDLNLYRYDFARLGRGLLFYSFSCQQLAASFAHF